MSITSTSGSASTISTGSADGWPEKAPGAGYVALSYSICKRVLVNGIRKELSPDDVVSQQHTRQAGSKT
jgi:hypothetical protein